MVLPGYVLPEHNALRLLEAAGGVVVGLRSDLCQRPDLRPDRRGVVLSRFVAARDREMDGLTLAVSGVERLRVRAVSLQQLAHHSALAVFGMALALPMPGRDHSRW